MTDPEVKLSEKVRELVDDLSAEGLLVGDSYEGLTSSEAKDRAAQEIQASLSEPLEALRKARKFIRGRHSTISYGPKLLLDEVDAILSKWQVE